MAKGFNSLLERFLVFETVTSFMLCITALTGPVLNNAEMERILINWYTYLLLAVSGLVFILIQQIFAREKIKPYLHIVSCVFYVIFAVVISGLCGQMNQPYVLIPFLIAQYFLENALNNLFVFHDRFMDECGQLSGKELETHLFHNNLSAIDFGAKARFAQGILLLLPLILFAAIFAILKSGYGVSIFALCLVLSFFLGLTSIFFLMGLFRNDVFFGFLGFRDYIQNKGLLLRSVFVIVLAACLFGAVISSNNALIRITYEERPASEIKYEMPEINSNTVNGASDIREILEEMYPDDNRFPDWIIDLIFKIIKWAAITALSGCVIVFFFKPFFSAHWKQFWKEGKLLFFLQNIWKQIKDFFRYVFTKKAAQESYSSVQSRKFGEGIKDFLKKAGRSKEKNAEIDRLTKHFMRLIDWGQAHNIQYRPNLAPAEYTDLLVQSLQTEELKKAAKSAGLLFEKALYDKEILSASEEKDFVSAVKTVIAGNPENQE